MCASGWKLSPRDSRCTNGNSIPFKPQFELPFESRMALHIVIDARRIRDFGIGTYIRSLILALGAIDTANQYTLVTAPADARLLAGLPEDFRSAVYARRDQSFLDHVTFPVYLRAL